MIRSKVINKSLAVAAAFAVIISGSIPAYAAGKTLTADDIAEAIHKNDIIVTTHTDKITMMRMYQNLVFRRWTYRVHRLHLT